MTTKDTKKPSDNGWEKEEVSELDILKAQVAELKAMLDNTVGKSSEEEEIRKIQQDDYIPVMSLLPYHLNLSTKERGQGNIKKFTRFGEVKRILYSDLVDIMEVHPNFVDSGYFYIMDKDVIRQHGLDDTYTKILTKEKIEKILDTSSEECVELYKSANSRQQEVIIQLLMEKLKEEYENINLNIIDKISRISKIDIIQKVEDSKRLKEELFPEE